MNRLSLRINRLKFKTLGKLPPVILDESMEDMPKLIKKYRKDHNMSDLETLGF